MRMKFSLGYKENLQELRTTRCIVAQKQGRGERKEQVTVQACFISLKDFEKFLLKLNFVSGATSYNNLKVYDNKSLSRKLQQWEIYYILVFMKYSMRQLKS